MRWKMWSSTIAPERRTNRRPTQPAVLTQKGCRYAPHILAFQVNQDFEIVNEDQTSHNIHPMPSSNREWNKSQPPGAPPDRGQVRAPGIHSREVQYPPVDERHLGGDEEIRTTRLPPVNGEFKLPNLPPGNYTITAWHESYGEQTQTSDHHWQRNEDHEFRFQSQTVLRLPSPFCLKGRLLTR